MPIISKRYIPAKSTFHQCRYHPPEVYEESLKSLFTASPDLRTEKLWFVFLPNARLVDPAINQKQV